MERRNPNEMNKSSNAEESSKKVVQHCKTLKSLLEVLPLPCPPRNQILEILKTNVQLLSAFIEQQGHLNRQKGFSNQQKSTSYQSDVTDANTALTSAVSSFASQLSYDALNDYSRILNAISKTDPQSGAAQAHNGSSTQLQSLSTDAARLPTPPWLKSAPWQASLPTDEADVVPPAPIISDAKRQRVAAPDASRGENSIKQMQTANLILSSGTGGGNMAVQVSFTSAVPVPVAVSPDKSQSHYQHPHPYQRPNLQQQSGAPAPALERSLPPSKKSIKKQQQQRSITETKVVQSDADNNCVVAVAQQDYSEFILY